MLDSNQQSTDSGLCEFPHSLDFLFTLPFGLGGGRQVSTPSSFEAWLGIAMNVTVFRFPRI